MNESLRRHASAPIQAVNSVTAVVFISTAGAAIPQLQPPHCPCGLTQPTHTDNNIMMPAAPTSSLPARPPHSSPRLVSTCPRRYVTLWVVGEVQHLSEEVQENPGRETVQHIPETWCPLMASLPSPRAGAPGCAAVLHR